MRLQTGIDLIEISRIEGVLRRFGGRFLRRIYTSMEQAICRGRPPELAARFAAKEAVMKALGTGRIGVGWREIEILSDVRGRPIVLLHGRALARAEALGLKEFSVSLSHARDMAVASVVAWGSAEDGA